MIQIHPPDKRQSRGYSLAAVTPFLSSIFRFTSRSHIYLHSSTETVFW